VCLILCLKTDPARVLGFVDLINGTGDGVPVNLKKTPRFPVGGSSSVFW
jgi:hypothetical protein